MLPRMFSRYLSFAPTSRTKNVRDMGHALFLRPKGWLAGVTHRGSRSLRDVGAELRYREDSEEYGSADRFRLIPRMSLFIPTQYFFARPRAVTISSESKGGSIS